MQKYSGALKATQPNLATYSTHPSTAKLVGLSILYTTQWNLKQKNVEKAALSACGL